MRGQKLVRVALVCPFDGETFEMWYPECLPTVNGLSWHSLGDAQLRSLLSETRHGCIYSKNYAYCQENGLDPRFTLTPPELI